MATMATVSPPVYGQPSLLLNINLSTDISFLVLCDFEIIDHSLRNKMFLQTVVESPLAHQPSLPPMHGACLQLQRQLDWRGAIEILRNFLLCY